LDCSSEREKRRKDVETVAEDPMQTTNATHNSLSLSIYNLQDGQSVVGGLLLC